MTAETPTSFYVLVRGELESVVIPGGGQVFARYEFVYGPDWEVVKSRGERPVLEDAVSQMAHVSGGPDPIAILNFPLELPFRSTNPFGWPQFVCSVYDVDRLGHDRLVGYGRAHVPVPTSPSFSVVKKEVIRLFRPVASSPIQTALSWFTGKRPEFVHSSFVAQCEGRDVTHVVETGEVHMRWDISSRHLDYFGYLT